MRNHTHWLCAHGTYRVTWDWNFRPKPPHCGNLRNYLARAFCGTDADLFSVHIFEICVETPLRSTPCARRATNVVLHRVPSLLSDVTHGISNEVRPCAQSQWVSILYMLSFESRSPIQFIDWNNLSNCGLRLWPTDAYTACMRALE